MRVLVLGAGVEGITTAYFLHKHGHEVTVVDRQPEAAHECSYANGGQLSYCHAEPWASPGSLKKAMQWFGKKDAPLLFKFRADMEMWRWIAKFISHCNHRDVARGTEIMLRLGLYSREVLHRNESNFNFDYNYEKTGKFFIFRDEKSMEEAINHSEFQAPLGAPYDVLTPREVVKREPALGTIEYELKGAIWNHKDETADIRAFTQGLAAQLAKSGVEFMYDTTVHKILTEGTQVKTVRTDRGELFGYQAVVMALGAYSPLYLRPIGIDVPVYPMKGYSISIPVGNATGAPTHSITNGSAKIVYSRLGKILRVAGTAEFAGYNHDIRPERIRMLKAQVKADFPHAGDIDNAEEWACLRPSTPDGPPILGRTKYDNLYLNTGHGTLGWTQALGSAAIVTDIIEGHTPEISLDGLTMERYH